MAVTKVLSGNHPNVVDVITDGSVKCVLNTSGTGSPAPCGRFHIRRAAAEKRIPCFTSSIRCGPQPGPGQRLRIRHRDTARVRRVNIEEARIISTQPAWEGAFHNMVPRAVSNSRRRGRAVRNGPLQLEGYDPMFARAFSYYRIDGERFALSTQSLAKGRAGSPSNRRGRPSGSMVPRKRFTLPTRLRTCFWSAAVLASRRSWTRRSALWSRAITSSR